MYQKARKVVLQRQQDMTDQYVEHAAVELASDWLAGAMDYNDPKRSPGSCYVTSIEEAVSWARLSDGAAKKQLRGMRRKLQDIRLDKIGRFIGKSGENPRKKEKSLLQKALALHFHFNHNPEQSAEFKYQNWLDWINEVPFGVLQRAYRLLARGASDRTIISLAEAEIDAQKDDRGVNREDISQAKYISKVLERQNLGNQDFGVSLIRELEECQEITDQEYGELAIPLASVVGATYVFDHWDRFSQIGEEKHLELAKLLVSMGAEDVLKVLENLDKLVGVKLEDHFELVEAVFCNLNVLYRKPELLGRTLDKFNIDPKDHSKLARIVIDRDPSLIASVVNILPGIEPADGLALARRCAQNGNWEELLSVLHILPGIKPENYSELISIVLHCNYGFSKPDKIHSIINKISVLLVDGSDHRAIISESISSYISIGKLSEAIGLNQRYGEPVKILTKAYEDFRDNLTSDIYSLYVALDAGNVPEEAEQFGVEDSGALGISQLKRGMQELKSKIIGGVFPEALLATSEIARQIAMVTMRVDISQWGAHDTQVFDDTVRRYHENKHRYRPLPEAYKPSKTVNIKKIDAQQTEQMSYRQDFLDRYRMLLSSVREAQAMLADDKEVNRILSFIREKRQVAVEQYERKLSGIPEEKAQANFAKKIDVLKNLDLENFNYPLEKIKILRSYRGEFDEEIRQMLFYVTFKFNPTWVEKDLASFDYHQPTVDQITWLLDFVSHVAKEETLGEYFEADKGAYKELKSLLNAKAIREQLSDLQNMATRGTTPVRFAPSRDLRTEFSGHMADACWASKYDSILERFPNLVSVTMMKNPEDIKNISVVGACLLLETVSKTGEALLVIRGLNPVENFINAHARDDFYRQFVDYLKPIANALGRKLAIVIDNQSGGSSTNRPMLFNYLTSIKNNLKPIRLLSEHKTTFNEYNIVNDCYLVD